MITINGAEGEGGGQILRTSLALSMVTRRPVRMINIRAGRAKPGLLRQHLTAVEAACAIGAAQVSGAALGSQELEFHPGEVTPGDYRFAVGTAGSATLVLQTVLPPLLTASGRCTLTLEGGTHNPMAPPFDFLARSFAPLIRRMGAGLELELIRPGFFPVGGGQFHARIEPAKCLGHLDLLDRGVTLRQRARAVLSKLPEEVGQRELAAVCTLLGWDAEQGAIENVDRPVGPGNVVLVEIETEQVSAVFSGFGERGRRAEDVARGAADQARAWLESGVPVDKYLADQLLLPMALAGGGSFRTVKPSLHSLTNAAVIERFLPVQVRFEPETENVWRVRIIA